MNLVKIKNPLPKDNVWNIKSMQTIIKYIQDKKIYNRDEEINKIYNKFMESVPMAVNYVICYPDYFTISLDGNWTTGSSTMRTHLGAFISENGSSVCLTKEQEELWEKLNALN